MSKKAPTSWRAHAIIAGAAVGLGVLAFLGGAAPLQRPSVTTTGLLTRIDAFEGKGRNVYVDLAFADGHVWGWACNSRSCEPSVDVLRRRSVQWSLPKPATMVTRSGRVVGLKIDGADVIVEEDEIGRRNLGAAGTGLLASVLSGAILVGWRAAIMKRQKRVQTITRKLAKSAA